MEVSNPDKVMFPAAGLTKRDLVDHYERVGERMLPFVVDSPLTLERYPSGIGGKGFRQKNASDYFPAHIGRIEIDKADGGTTSYPTVDTVEGLAYLANQGTITFHPWTSRLPRLDEPDFLVLDLDPTEDDLTGVRSVAHTTCETLGDFGLESMPVTSGSKGFHIWVPLVTRHHFDVVATCARAIAGLVAGRNDRATTEFLKEDRAGRVFVDWLRNGWGASIASPWSVRARANAPVATPIPRDLIDSVEPGQWTIADVDDAPEVRTPPPQTLVPDRIVEGARSAGVDLDSHFDRFGRRR